MTEGALQYLASGIVLGLSAGLSPGPLMAFLLRESLSRSAAAGIRAACSPLATDLPIVVGAVFMLETLAAFEVVLGVISLAGAAFLVHLGWETVRTASLDVDPGDAPATWWRGILVNVLSPHPYLFWMTVGAPLLIQAATGGLLAPGMFLAGFYFCLVGSKVTVAIAAARFRKLLGGRVYGVVMKALGAALWVLALMFLVQGIAHMRPNL